MTTLAFGRLSMRVWQRNLDVFAKTWKTSFVLPVLEPLLYLGALGYGLGGLLSDRPLPGHEGVSYPQFLAAGIAAATMMNVAFFEGTFASYVRMHFQRTYDAITATPVSLNDVIVAEILWGATKALFNVAVVLAVIASFGLADAGAAVVILLVALPTGLLFAALGVCFSATVPSIDHFSWPIYLLVTPMFLFSGTFFPLEGLPGWAQAVSLALPLTHAVEVSRAATLGTLGVSHLANAGALLLGAAVAWVAAILLMRRKLIR